MSQLSVQDFLTALAKVESEDQVRELCPFPALLGLPAERPAETAQLAGSDFGSQLAILSPVLRQLPLYFVAPSAPAQPVSLGTSAGSDVRIQEPSISRRHALFVRRGGTWSLKDLEAKNGSYLEGRRVPVGIPLPLHGGAGLRFGEWRGLFLTTRELLDLLAACKTSSADMSSGQAVPEVGAQGTTISDLLAEDFVLGTSSGFLLESPVSKPGEELSEEEHTREVSPSVILSQKRGLSNLDLRLHAIPNAGPRGALVGRGADCEVAIPGASVSKHHARFRLKGQTWLVMDLESSNGTHVAERRIPAGVWTQVPVGSTVSIGAYRTVLISPEQARQLLDDLRGLREREAQA